MKLLGDKEYNMYVYMYVCVCFFYSMFRMMAEFQMDVLCE